MRSLKEIDTIMDNDTDTTVCCRLCNQTTDNMHHVLEKNGNGKQILSLIKDCLPIIIYRTDPLSKQICELCYNTLENFHDFKQQAIKVANEHQQHLKNLNGQQKDVQLYLNSQEAQNKDATTSTEDLIIRCKACKMPAVDSKVHDEIELCAELQKAIAASLTNNKTDEEDDDDDDDEGDEEEDVDGMKRPIRRRRSQAFYHELDDSLCSSITECTNTESSQAHEDYHSEIDSSDSELGHDVKRIKLEKNVCTLKQFENEEEKRYFPLSLLMLTLNVINKQNVPDYEPDDFYVETIRPECGLCKQTFQNSKMLALHEIEHMSIELGEKIDNPSPWHESRDDSKIRNTWLEHYSTKEAQNDAQALLIPKEVDDYLEEAPEYTIELVNSRPMVNGIYLSDYTKEERKAFYQTMRIGNVNRKFCALCRYSFKDNWAIESHYFSSACYYTCRYCGMRFNKQRHRYDSHVRDHVRRGDQLSKKVYSASKLNNVLPRCQLPFEIKRPPPPPPPSPPRVQPRPVGRPTARRSLPVKIKEEPMDVKLPPSPNTNQTPPGKINNQAYFCRKCYKVFFKIDEFNVHIKHCDYNHQFPPVRKYTRHTPSTNGDVVSPTGRPLRNCVKEVTTYRDEMNESPPVRDNQKEPPFICMFCGMSFKTVYSRNSHMRIHKMEATLPSTSQLSLEASKNSFNIKKEPLEPEVQIHETEYLNNVGSVSITPISKNPNQKATINPNIMKLVQSNPHLTIKTNPNDDVDSSSAHATSTVQNNRGSTNNPDADGYKCLSCWATFTNKSQLYFHKQNRCEGSKYPCPFCKKRFGTESAYSSHIFYSHPE